MPSQTIPLAMKNRSTHIDLYRGGDTDDSKANDYFVNCFVNCRYYRIGNMILLWGKRSTTYPFQLLVGPEWPCMLVTYTLIIIPSVLFIRNVCITWGPVLVTLGCISTLALLCAFSATACSDPGIIFKFPASDLENLEDQSSSDLIECSICNIGRPKYASHCYECGVCISEIDHHCPWTGKCIGKKNLVPFYWFLGTLCFQLIFVIGTVILSVVMNKDIFPASR